MAIFDDIDTNCDATSLSCSFLWLNLYFLLPNHPSMSSGPQQHRISCSFVASSSSSSLTKSMHKIRDSHVRCIELVAFGLELTPSTYVCLFLLE